MVKVPFFLQFIGKDVNVFRDIGQPPSKHGSNSKDAISIQAFSITLFTASPKYSSPYSLDRPEIKIGHTT